MTFAIGQRWISETENNLGLGIIEKVDMRTLTILFPASNEQRIYAIQNAPLARVQFQPGDEIQHQQGWRGKVLQVQENQGLLIYLVQHGEQQQIVSETELAHQISFLS